MIAALRKLRAADVAAFAAIAMIAFQLYYQYWFVRAAGAWTVNPLLPIAILSIASLIHMWRDGRWPDWKTAVPAMWAFLGAYLLWSSAAILLHEGDLKRAVPWLVYVWSPPAVFVTIHGLKNFRSNRTVDACCVFLFVLMLFLSVYSLYALNSRAGPIEKPAVKWGDREVVYDSRAGTRYALPGLNSSHYGPMLIPMVFLGLYWAHRTERTARYLFLAATAFLAYCLFATVTRAAILGLVLGLAYLMWAGCIRGRALALSACMTGGLFVLHPAIGARLMTLSPIMQGAVRHTLAEIVRAPHSVMEIIDRGPTRGLPPHLVVGAHTLGLIAQRPLAGVGIGHLVDMQNSVLSHYDGKTTNNFLAIGASFGLPALLFYALFIGSLAFNLRRAVLGTKMHSQPWRMAHTWMAILIAFAAYLNGAPAEFHFVWLWFALISIWLRNQFAQ
jgi:hypothetical protein